MGIANSVRFLFIPPYYKVCSPQTKVKKYPYSPLPPKSSKDGNKRNINMNVLEEIKWATRIYNLANISGTQAVEKAFFLKKNTDLNFYLSIWKHLQMFDWNLA